MKLYGLKTCDSCRKALKELATRGYDVNYLDVRKEGVPTEVMTQAYEQFGEKLVNKSSTTWRGLTAEQKGGDFLDLLVANPTLMKRPLIVADGRMTLGWKDDAQVQYPAR